jgi:hypothetical protein
MKLCIWQSRALLAVVMILTTSLLPSCTAYNRGAPSSPSVQIPRDCEELAKRYSVPPDSKSVRVTLVRTRTALVGAIDSLDDTRECQALQRERLARGAVK